MSSFVCSLFLLPSFEGAFPHAIHDRPPSDVTCLEQVVSNRRSFQDYLLKSLEASNELKQSNAKLEAELSRYLCVCGSRD